VTQRLPVVQSDPDIMGATLVFVGTRVPLETLLDDLESGQPRTAIAALEPAKEALLALARPA